MARSVPRRRRRGGARRKAILSWWRRNRFPASSRRGDLKKSMTNVMSECKSANIVRDHAMILPEDATPKPDGIFGKDTSSGDLGWAWMSRRQAVIWAWKSAMRLTIGMGLLMRWV